MTRGPGVYRSHLKARKWPSLLRGRYIDGEAPSQKCAAQKNILGSTFRVLDYELFTDPLKGKSCRRQSAGLYTGVR